VTGKKVTHKSSLENGKKTVVSTEEIHKPDGTREIVETTNEDGKITTSKYNLAKRRGTSQAWC